MPRESLKSKRERALVVCERMGEHYPAAQPALDFGGDPFRLTIAVLLSAQTTDAAVNKVTPELWKRYPTIEDLAAAIDWLLPRQGGELHKVRSDGAVRIRRRSATYV